MGYIEQMYSWDFYALNEIEVAKQNLREVFFKWIFAKVANFQSGDDV